MTTFDDREKGFESKYALDQDQEFKAVARRNKLLGLWAAEKMGLNADRAEEYVDPPKRALGPKTGVVPRLRFTE